MALQIPNSPNIIGADAAMRSPDMVSPVSEKFDSSIDLSALGTAVKNVGGLYAEMEAEKERSALNTLRVSYTKHMSEYQQKVFREHTDLDAANLYERYIQPESNKWMSNIFGAPKEDGQLRISNKEMQKQFSEWVLGQQPTYISNSAIYGQKEFEKHNKLVSEEIDAEASNMLLSVASTGSQATMKNALNMLYNNAVDNAGGDPALAKHIFASKADAGLSAMIAQRAIENPVDANAWLNDPNISQYLSVSSKEKLKIGIQKSYLDLASKEAAIAKYSDGKEGSIGLRDNAVIIRDIFGVMSEAEVADIQGRINSKADEQANSIRKNVQGMRDDQISMATDQLLNAHNSEEWESAMVNLATVDPDAAEALSNAKIEYDSNDLDIIALHGREASALIGLREELTNVGGIDFDRYEEIAGEPLSKEAKRILLEEEGFDASKASDYQVKTAAANMVSQGRLTPEEAEAASRLYLHNQKLKNGMEQYKELSTRIASGEIQAYDSKTMGDLAPEIQMQLLEEMRVQNKLTKTKRALKDAGVDLDSVVSKTGADAQYKNMDMGSQNLFKNNLVMEVNQYRATHNGQLPSSEALEGIVYRVQRNSISPSMALTQRVLDEVNMSSDKLTDTQRYNLAINNATQPAYNPASKRTLTDQNKRAEEAIEAMAYDGNINSAERNFILINKEYLVRLLQNGATTQMANFLLMHNKWSY